MAFTIVDTDVLIDAARGNTVAKDTLTHIGQTSALAISVVTQMELIVGCRNGAELQTLEIFLVQFRVLRLNELITDRAVALLKQFRLSHGLLIADALIAATAIQFDEVFVTKNQKHFRFIPDLRLKVYP